MKKHTKQHVRNEVKTIVKKEKEKDQSFFGKVARGIKKAVSGSSIGINTPWGNIGYGLNGLVLNPPGPMTQVGAVTSGFTGKRQYYMTGVAPKRKGYTSGLRVVAAQWLSTAYQSATAAGAFNSAGNAVLDLGPDSVGGQMALDARNYCRYFIAAASLEYIPSVQVGFVSSGTITTAAQELVVAFANDPDQESFATQTYASIQSLADNTVTPVWQRGGLVMTNLGNPNVLLFTELDSGNASNRQTCQGEMIALWNATPGGSGSAVVGEFVLHYVMDLYDRAPDYGFTLAVDPSIGFEVLTELFRRYGDKVLRRDRARLLRHLAPPKRSDKVLEALDSLVPSTRPYSPPMLIEHSELRTALLKAMPPLSIDTLEKKESATPITKTKSRDLR